jgi:peptidoglycan/xylan/chitin deacetylase (PgdA/CDA1 family)
VRGTITSVATAVPAAALTFDDGPDPDVTPALLRVLAVHGARATFFVVGEAARREPGLIGAIKNAGHAIGNHTWSHPPLPTLGMIGHVREIARCSAAVGAGMNRLLRPPYGRQTWRSHLRTRLLGYRVVAWSIDAEDWRGGDADSIAARVLQRLGPGDIVLFHDGLVDAVGRRQPAPPALVPAVSRILDRLHDRLAFVTVPELLRCGRARRRHWHFSGDRSDSGE